MVDWDHAKSQVESMSGGRGYYSFKENNRIIFLPLKEDEGSFFYPLGKHWVNDAGGRLTVICPRMTPVVVEEGKKPTCLICKHLIPAARQALPDAEVRKLVVKKRPVALAIDVEDPKRGIQIVGLPVSVLDVLVSYGQEGSPIADDKNPCVVNIKRTGSGINTKYTVVPGKVVPITKIAKAVGMTTREFMDSRPNLAKVIRDDYKEEISQFAAAVLAWRPEIGHSLSPSFKEQYMSLPAPEREDIPDDWESPPIDADFTEADCDAFGSYDPEDEGCQGCEDEDECKAKTEAVKKQKGKKGKGKKGKGKKKKGKSSLAEGIDDDGGFANILDKVLDA